MCRARRTLPRTVSSLGSSNGVKHEDLVLPGTSGGWADVCIRPPRAVMGPLFPRWTNGAYWAALVAIAGSVIGVLVGLMLFVRTPWNTRQLDAVDQPVEFDHRHHVIDDEIDCLYCHRTAEVSDYASVPATDVCMGCHAQIHNESPLLEPVRRSYFSGQPIPWNRVHDVPDFVYFNHAVHVQTGIGCVTCHGRVDQMARVFKVTSLSMGWCVECHAEAHQFQNANTTLAGLDGSLWGTHPAVWQPEVTLGPRRVSSLTTCTACHR